jgi:hypothetical protein
VSHNHNANRHKFRASTRFEFSEKSFYAVYTDFLKNFKNPPIDVVDLLITYLILGLLIYFLR